jgi:hypothetical protein
VAKGTSPDYVAKNRKLDGAGLLKMYLALAAGQRIAGWPQGKAFEHLILQSFELAGAEVTWPYGVDLAGSVVEQIDGVVRTDRVHSLIESKHYKGRVNVEPVAKIRNQLSRRPAGTIASVFALNGFTEPASVLTRYSSPLNVLLWEKDDIELILRDSVTDVKSPVKALHKKYNLAVEYGLPDYALSGGYK